MGPRKAQPPHTLVLLPLENPALVLGGCAQRQGPLLPPCPDCPPAYLRLSLILPSALCSCRLWGGRPLSKAPLHPQHSLHQARGFSEIKGFTQVWFFSFLWKPFIL